MVFYQFAFVAALAAYSVAFRLDQDFMTTADMERYFSVSTAEEVPEYDIVNPTAYSAGGRHKRDLHFEETKKTVKFSAFGEDYDVSLEENTELLRSDLQAERHNADGTIDLVPVNRRCYYIGNLASHEISKVAVSTCNGMSGMISTDKYDMFIQPLTEEHANKYKRARRDAENPHIIYRRQTDQPNNSDGSFCALDVETYRISALYHTSLPEMDDMHASFANDPVEVAVDFKQQFNLLYPTEDETTDETTTIDEDYPYFDSTTAETVTEEPPADESDDGKTRKESAPSGDGDEGSRRKRQTKSTKYLEVRVLADADMTRYHGDNVIPYTLTLMNVVAARYQEPSLERTIVIHIVKLGHLTSDFVQERSPNGAQVQFQVTTDGPSTLNSWSTFQWQTNSASDADPSHWDNAVLISRKNLRVNGIPNLLGIAWGNATCYLPRQANLNQDQGLSSGLVIAHEIGHNLGMNHDSDNGCTNGINVMSSHRPNGPASFQWSRCSVVDLDRFLNDPFKTCLNDQPTSASQWPLNASDRPGATLSADEQCRLQSTDTTIFLGSCTTNLAGICANLFCRTAQSCWSSVAAAEGTSCGGGRSCVSGQCVFDSAPPPPPTTTYEWRTGAFGQCSVTCGPGVQSRSVTCYSSTNSAVGDSLCNAAQQPQNTQSCNLGTCPTVTAFWQPLNWGTCSDTTCQQTRLVLCVISNGNNLQQVDPSRCTGTKPPTTQSCNSNNCRPQWVTSAFSQCSARCGGGTRTRTVTCRSSSSQTLPDSQCAQSGTKPATTEACNTQSCGPTYSWFSSNNYGACSVTCGTGTQSTLVLCVDSQSNRQVADSLCLQQIQGPKPQGSTRQCNEGACGQWAIRPSSQCSVTCGQGTQQLQVYCRSTTSNTNLPDSSCDPNTKPPNQRTCNAGTCPPTYSGEWAYTSYSQCSVTCGQGIQERQVICRSTTSNTILPDSSCDPNTKPSSTQRTCNPGTCPQTYSGEWTYTSYSQCSVTCGQGIQQRQVFCKSTTSNTILPDSSCDPNSKPSSTQRTCNAGTCPITYNGEWVISSWSQCSVTCGQGTQERLVICRSTTSNQNIPDSFCNQPKPSTHQSCNTGTCQPTYSGEWATTRYSDCSESCGQGTQQRQVICRSSTTNTILPDSSCNPINKPPSQQPCNGGNCPPTYSGQWQFTLSECSVTCGQGTQQRQVYCWSTTSNTILPDSSCDPNTKPPPAQQTCNAGNCPSNPPPTSNSPNQGVPCAGVYTRSVNNLNIFGNGQRGCREVIVAQPGQLIKLTFTQCSIECPQSDAVRRGKLRDATKDVVNFCCSGPYDDSTGQFFTWTSETHVLGLEIDDTRAGQGFAVNVEIVGQPNAGCNGALTAPSGTVTSPNYPNSYPDPTPNNWPTDPTDPRRRVVCQTVIIAPPGKKVQVTFNVVDLFFTWPYCGANDDKFEVYNLHTLFGEDYCGRYQNPNNLQKPSLDNWVLVQFVTNNDGRARSGFSMDYTFV